MGPNGSTMDGDDREHLERSREVWDYRSDRYDRSERDLAPMLDDAVERLGVEPGDAVLEIGCGPGTNLQRLHDLVGPGGRFVAVDYSPEMVENARDRAEAAGLENVEVIRADASTVALDPETFDAALASLSMSVLPDPEAAALRVREALRPGGRFVVFDVRGFRWLPLRPANPLLRRFYRWYANWNPETDVLDAVEAAFGDVEVEEIYFSGAGYRAVATKPVEGDGA